MSAVAFVSGQSPARVHASLRRSLVALEEAQQCAVLWFGEVMKRRLYRDFECSSMNQYAVRELGFSQSRARDFVRLAQKLESLPVVKAAVVSGDLGYTKAREVIKVVTPATQDDWLRAAAGTRDQLVHEVKRAQRAAKVDPNQGELLPSEPTVVAARELPIRFSLQLTPEQEARRAALVERLHKLGGIPTDPAELMLEALDALVGQNEGPRRPRATGPSVQIHVHENVATGRMTVQTDHGERELSPAESSRLHCDAVICKPGERNKATIPPSVRREVLSRDHHKCQSPGCGRTRFLEVHHLKPRTGGGTNHPDNLTTLCSSCHRLWHEAASRAG